MKHTAFTLLALCTLFLSTPTYALEKVRLQLKWEHQFQFAGYYVAKELGYYRDVGLDVEIIEARPNTDSIATVLQGDAEYGVGNSGIILSRHEGKPLTVLAVIMQHSPFILLTRPEETINGIQDLAGKSLMIEPLADEIVAFLNQEELPLDSFDQVFVDLHDLEPFVRGEVAAIDAYSTDEPYELMKRGIPFNTFNPRSAGIDFYGDNLFTTERELKHHPERVKNFREASLRGWRYAMTHKEEAADLILANYPTKLDRDYLLYEAQQMQQLMYPEIIEVGYMREERWQHIAETYASLGMLPDNISLQGFLYNPNPKKSYLWLFVTFAITLLVLSIVIMVNVRFSKLNQKLTRLLHIQTKFANIGESVNNISHQWKQPLNELGIQLMRIEQLTVACATQDNNLAEVKKLTEKGHDVLEFMANTIDAFGHVLKTGKSASDFSPGIVIQEVHYLIRDSFKQHAISIDYRGEEEVSLHGNSTEFAHVVLSILNNARDIFVERRVTDSRIMIRSYRRGKDYCLDISDNAGGIRAEPVDRIFELGVSDKQSDHSGVGLYIAKKIIEDGFHGKIGVKNDEKGAVFTLVIPLPA